MAALLSVNVGHPRRPAWADIGRTSIDKRAVTGPVARGRSGSTATRSPTPAPTAVSTRRSTPSPARTSTTGRASSGEPIRDGQFGENLTTEGIDVNEAEVGERWRIGDAVLRGGVGPHPVQRLPELDGRVSGYDNGTWVKRFARGHRPGPYLRVVGEGTLSAGDEIEVVHRPGHGVTVSTMFRALTTDRDAAARAAEGRGLSVPQARARPGEYSRGAI